MITIHDYVAPDPYTFDIVFRGMRFSWGSNDKSDSRIDYKYALEDDYTVFNLGEADKALALKLINAGPDHGKFMRQLPIVVDVTGPNYWFVELDTYKVGSTRNSSSKMHTAGKRHFIAEDFSFENLPASVISSTLDNLDYLRTLWIDAGKRKGPEAEAWRAMLQAIPDSYNYRSVWSANYQVLRNIYFARRNHRLGEWRQFTDWITNLPYAELITAEKSNQA